MAKQKNKYAIHPDFTHFPTIYLSYRPLAVSLMNLLLKLEHSLRQLGARRRAKKHRFTTRDGHDVRILQFNPEYSDGPVPAVIYLHGGAYVLTYASTHVYSADYYARQAGCAVFLVDYRLAHRHPFPDGLQDCNAALDWVLAHAAQLGVDPERIAVMGDSAGGGLAAVMAQQARDENGPALCAQVLIYPTIDHRCETPSATQFTDTPLWNAINNRGMWECYLRPYPEGMLPSYASPAARSDLSGLPPAYIETAEFDPLRDEAIEYARRLENAGVPVELRQTQATIHAFDTVFTSQITRDSLRLRCDYLQSMFRMAGPARAEQEPAGAHRE